MFRFQNIKFIPKSIWIISIAGFLINISTAIVFGLSTGFMRYHLGFSVCCVGTIQGLVEALSYGIKFTSGIFSDIFRKRKLLMLVGLGLIAVSKPVIALSTTIMIVFLARAIDRIGNGLQSTPRDALIGDLSTFETRGQAFGLKQMLTVAGSTLGSFLAIPLMFWTGDNYRLIFMLAGIPCFISFVFVYFFVPDPIAEEKSKTLLQKINTMISEMMILAKNYWVLMGVVFVFMLSRYGEAPLILNAIETMGLPERFAPAVMICYNSVNSMISYPIGFLSDRIGREKVLSIGIICAMIANLIIANAGSIFWMFVGVAFWGVQMSITLTMFLALITDYSPMHVRGTAIGIFYFISFIAVLFGSQIYAFCTESFGTLSSPFIAGALFSSIALVLTIIFLKPNKEKLARVSK